MIISSSRMINTKANVLHHYIFMIISRSRMINTKANIKTKTISISRVVIKVQDPRIGLITFLICNRIMNQISTIS